MPTHTTDPLGDYLQTLPFPSGDSDYGQSGLYAPRAELVKRLKPRSVFEIGTLHGWALVACVYAAESIHRVAWLDDETHTTGSNEQAHRNLRHAFNDLHRRIDPHLSYWAKRTDNLANYAHEYGAQVVLVDGAHTYLDCYLDLWLAMEFRPEVLLVDDTIAHADEIVPALDRFCSRLRRTWFEVDTINGLGIIPLTSRAVGALSGFPYQLQSR